MKRLTILFTGIFLISGLLLISCQKKEAESEHGVAVQTYEKAKDTMDVYKKKNEEASGQMRKEEAGSYGK
ncbi:MAG: hypothetical protein HY809_01040 [Nitrospirae bacterium]|nr:hypothetical protein [Nitrospirota bacterium]